MLHPFYRKKFADNYDHLSQLNLTFPLIERIAWEEILRKTGISDIKKLALAITHDSCSSQFRDLIKKEHEILCSFYKFVDIVEPYWVEDKIPEDLIVIFLEILMKLGYKEIKVGHGFENTIEKIDVVKLTEESKFENALNLSRKNFISTIDDKFCLKLPYHDLPYTFLLTNEISSSEIEAEFKYEGFFAEDKTKVYWHIEK